MIGAMAMPADFQYKEVFLKGYPHHDSSDSFRLKHPCMKPGRRAKLFNPFDVISFASRLNIAYVDCHGTSLYTVKKSTERK